MFIGVTGKAGAGKDTLAYMIAMQLKSMGVMVRHDSYAHPIRQIAHHMGLQPYDRDRKEMTARIEWSYGLIRDSFDMYLPHLDYNQVQALADKAQQVFAPYTCLDNNGRWLDISPRVFMQLLGTEVSQTISKTLWVDALKRRANKEEVVIISDVRFPHELEFLQDLIFIERTGVQSVAKHASESHFAVLKQASTALVLNDSDMHSLLLNAAYLTKEIYNEVIAARSGSVSEGTLFAKWSEGHCATCTQRREAGQAVWDIGQHPCVLVGEA